MNKNFKISNHKSYPAILSEFTSKEILFNGSGINSGANLSLYSEFKCEIKKLFTFINTQVRNSQKSVFGKIFKLK